MFVVQAPSIGRQHLLETSYRQPATLGTSRSRSSARARVHGALTVSLALVAGCRVETSPTSTTTLVADSVHEFSGRQGQRNWFYGFWNRSVDANGSYDSTTDFQLLEHFGDDPKNGLSSRSEFTTGKLWNLRDGSYYTSLWAEGGHPHGELELGEYASVEHWAVRRWVSTVDGAVNIRGQIGKVMPWGKLWKGGCKAMIVVDGKTVFTGTMGNQSDSYSVDSQVHRGSTIDFLIGPDPSIGVTTFTAVIKHRSGVP